MAYQDDRLIFAAPDLLLAVRAHYAALVARDLHLGSFDQREMLGSYAEHLATKAITRLEDRDPPAEFEGRPRLGPAPGFATETASAAEAQALVEHVLKMERTFGTF